MRERAEDAVERAGEALGIDRADGGDLLAPVGDHPGVQVADVLPGDRGDALDRAARRMAVGVARKRLGEEAARGHDAGIVLLVAQPGDGLGAHALDRVLVEARRGQGEAQEREGLVGVPDERLERAADGVADRR